MGWSKHHPTGLIHNSAQNSYRGYTLFSNLDGPDHPAFQGKDLDPARYANLNRLYSPA